MMKAPRAPHDSKYKLILLVGITALALLYTTFAVFLEARPDENESRLVVFLLVCLCLALATFLYQAEMRLKAGSDHYAVAMRYRYQAERFRFTLDAVVNAYWDWHLEEGSIQYNGNLQTDLGYPSQPAADSEFWRKITHPADRPMIKYKLYRHLQDESSACQFEYRLLTSSGNYQWYLAKGKVISRDPAGRPVRMVGSIENISARMTMQIALEDSRRKFLDIFHSTPEGMLILHFESAAVTDVNDRMVQLLGYDRSEFDSVIRRWLTAPQQQYFLQELGRSSIYENFETRAETADGVTLSLSVSGKVIVLNGMQHLLLIVEDIGERKRLERSLQEAGKMEAVGQLTAGIAHDFNNILASVMGYTELAMNTPLDRRASKLPAYLKEIHAAGSKASDLVRQLLTFSRRGSTSVTQIDLPEQTHEALRMVRSTLPTSIDIAEEFGQQPHHISIDPIQLQRVIVNLCINARDAMDGCGTLSLTIEERTLTKMECTSCHLPFEGTFCELSIADSGSGMDQLVMHHIFEPFFTSKEVGEGSGMGLPVVHGIMHELGGHILVESAPKAGTLIRLLFRPHGSDLQRPADEQEPVDTPETVDMNGKHVMVLDDEEPIANYLAEVFAQQGCQVTVVTDSRRAFELYERDPDGFDLVVTDQTMPVISGAELAQEMLNIRPQQPIILCTGYSVHLDDAKANAKNIGALLQKPVNTLKLLSESHRLLN